MILYHGSNIEIEKIDLKLCRLYKDFGRGFYLTAIESQARKMALRTSRIYGGKPGFLFLNINSLKMCELKHLTDLEKSGQDLL